MFRMLALACALTLSAGSALAQAPAAPSAATLPYGPPITLDQAIVRLTRAGFGQAEG